MNNLLMGVEECCEDSVPARRSFVWRENGRFFRLECKENNAGRFLLCFATDAEGKKHRLFFQEGHPEHKAVDKGGSSVENAVWVDAGDCDSGKALGILQFCLIGKWKAKPEPLPMVKEVETWVREAWRLNGGVMLAILYEDLLFLEFDSPEEARWVLESGRRSFKEGVLQLEQ